MAETFNKNELILDKVRSIATHDLGTGELLFRLTQLEEPTLNCTAESEEVTDAVGATITTLYRSKKASFSATNSLMSLDLAAAQYGAKKVVGSESAKITDYATEILTVADDHTITLSNIPSEDIKYIYSIANKEIGAKFTAGTEATGTNFLQDSSNKKKITLPNGVTGKIYVEYKFENADAVKVSNKASNFPEACSVVIYAYFKDACNENLTYSGKIVSSKAKLNPEQVELNLTSTGKHSFDIDFFTDYCAEEGDDELFSIIVSK